MPAFNAIFTSTFQTEIELISFLLQTTLQLGEICYSVFLKNYIT